ncbi:MAG: hypothetical protein ABIG39_05625 [Candidatus Micrarchaeota archaeon]
MQVPKGFSKRVLSNRAVVHHRDFPQILDSSTAGLEQLNSRYGSWVSRTYVGDGIVIREKKDRPNIIIKSKIIGDIHLDTGSVETWFHNALKAREAIKGERAVEFERPLGYSDSGNGTYYSLHYAGSPLSSAQYEIKLDEEHLISFVRGLAMLHSDDIYHHHLFADNIMVVAQQDDPTFVIIDPKFIYVGEHNERKPKTGSEPRTIQEIPRKEKIQHDIFPFVVACHRILEGTPPQKSSKFIRFLTRVEKTYQKVNRVSGDLLDERFFNALFNP